MTEFEQTVWFFEKEFGFEFLVETRKREYVEARATLIHYLYNFKKLGLTEISKLIYAHSGWKINHATIHHSIKNQPIYSKYNPKLDEVLRAIVGYFDKDADKIQYIKNTITRLPSEVIDELHQDVLDAYAEQLERELVIKLEENIVI